MKLLAIMSCFLTMLGMSVPCMAQQDTIRLVKNTFSNPKSIKKHNYFPNQVIRFSMLTPLAFEVANGTGTATPETALGPYRKKRMYGLDSMYNGKLFLVSRKEYAVLLALVRLINSQRIIANGQGSTPYSKKYLEKGAFYVSIHSNANTSYYVLSDEQAAIRYINQFISAVDAAELSSVTKAGVVDICKTSLSIIDVH